MAELIELLLLVIVNSESLALIVTLPLSFTKAIKSVVKMPAKTTNAIIIHFEL